MHGDGFDIVSLALCIETLPFFLKDGLRGSPKAEDGRRAGAAAPAAVGIPSHEGRRARLLVMMVGSSGLLLLRPFEKEQTNRFRALLSGSLIAMQGIWDLSLSFKVGVVYLCLPSDRI